MKLSFISYTYYIFSENSYTPLAIAKHKLEQAFPSNSIQLDISPSTNNQLTHVSLTSNNQSVIQTASEFFINLNVANRTPHNLVMAIVNDPSTIHVNVDSILSKIDKKDFESTVNKLYGKNAVTVINAMVGDIKNTDYVELEAYQAAVSAENKVKGTKDEILYYLQSYEKFMRNIRMLTLKSKIMV